MWHFVGHSSEKPCQGSIRLRLEEILFPNSLTFTPSCSVDFISTCRGEMAIGKGSKLPLVISTSIKAYKEFREILKVTVGIY